MNFDFVLTTHVLPLWFLVLALFLPRVCLAVAWLQHNLVPFHLHGYIPLFIALLLPRVLVLVLIYQDQGLTLWFLVHLVALLLAWGGGGSRIVGRRRAEQYVE
jgi:hypothetical protein